MKLKERYPLHALYFYFHISNLCLWMANCSLNVTSNSPNNTRCMIQDNMIQVNTHVGWEVSLLEVSLGTLCTLLTGTVPPLCCVVISVHLRFEPLEKYPFSLSNVFYKTKIFLSISNKRVFFYIENFNLK